MPETTTRKSAKALREERAPLAKTIRDLADKVNAEKRDFNSEEKPQWEQVNADYNELTRQITLAERIEQVDADQGEQRDRRREIGRQDAESRNGRNGRNGDGAEEITERHRSLALQAWGRFSRAGSFTEEHREACELLGVNPACQELDIPLLRTESFNRLQDNFRVHHPAIVGERMRGQKLEQRDMSAIAGPSGGYLVPPETLLRELEINLLYYGGMRQVAETIRTATGERLSWPTADDTTNTGIQLGENATIGTSVDPTFGKVYWDAYKYSSQPVLVPYELVEDSAFQLPTVLGQLLGIRLGRITNTKFTTGTGANTPKGIMTAATLGLTTASSTAIAFDEIVQLVHKIDPAYRATGCGFMLHDSILLAIRQLKDAMGRYLWESNVQTGVPDRLLSYPLTINQDMDSTVATTKKTILFGQLAKYKIRTVNSVRMYRLQERYRDTDQDGFIAFMREDGNLLDAGTHPVKYLQQA